MNNKQTTPALTPYQRIDKLLCGLGELCRADKLNKLRTHATGPTYHVWHLQGKEIIIKEYGNGGYDLLASVNGNPQGGIQKDIDYLSSLSMMDVLKEQTFLYEVWGSIENERGRKMQTSNVSVEVSGNTDIIGLQLQAREAIAKAYEVDANTISDVCYTLKA